jgi:phosphoribosylanthranilate isomerase
MPPAVRGLLAGTRFVLSGGLTADNVAAAVRELAPDVVDASSGLERAPGRKDPARVAAFVRSARGDGAVAAR